MAAHQVARELSSTHTWEPLLRSCGIPALRISTAFDTLRPALFIETLQWSAEAHSNGHGAFSSIAMTYDRYGHLFEREDDGAALKRLEAAVVAA